MNLLRKVPQNWRATAFTWCAGIVLMLGVVVAAVSGPSTPTHAAAPVPVEQVVTFACETTGNYDGSLQKCVAEANLAANEWLVGNAGKVSIIDRQANVTAGTHWRAYAVTIFYRK